jgi:LemA protein
MWKIVLGLIGGIIGVVVIISMIFGGFYNGLVLERNNVDKAWAEVEVQYQRRFDLIPALVESINAAFKQESNVFGNIADARRDVDTNKTNFDTAKSNLAKAEAGSEESISATTQIDNIARNFKLIVENYPQLKSIDTVANYQTNLDGTENRIAQARRLYNEAATTYNNKVQSFPTSILASMFNFKSKILFKGAEGSNQRPNVTFTN